jgi:hypothetical protein
MARNQKITPAKSMIAAVLLTSCGGMAKPAAAQITLSPSGGISGEGQPVVGAAVVMSLGPVRPELELGWARRGIDRRAATPSAPQRNIGKGGGPVYLPAVMAHVSTLMFRGIDVRVSRSNPRQQRSR